MPTGVVNRSAGDFFHFEDQPDRKQYRGIWKLGSAIIEGSGPYLAINLFFRGTYHDLGALFELR